MWRVVEMLLQLKLSMLLRQKKFVVSTIVNKIFMIEYEGYGGKIAN